MENIFEKKSSWIWTPDWNETDNTKPKLVYFRKCYLIESIPTQAIISVSADSRYRLYVNGVSVSFGPCKGDGEIWHYEEVDIAPYLKEGENVFAAVVLRYPTLRKQGNQSVWRTNLAGFFLEGNITFKKGKEMKIKSDDTWKTFKCNHIEIVPESDSLKRLWIFERAKAHFDTQSWKDVYYDDYKWTQAKAYRFLDVKKSVSPGNLVKRPIPVMYEEEKNFEEVFCIRQSCIEKAEWNALLHEKKKLTIGPNQHEIIEISASEMTTGFLQLNLIGGKDAKISITSAESYVYAEEGVKTLNRSVKKGNRTDCENGKLLGFEDRYEVGGYGMAYKPEVYEPFWFRTFRFIKLEIQTSDEALELTCFNYRETGYPLEVKTHVETSDDSLVGIWDISLRSLRRCMHETYEDCPFFEQLQYAMDTRSQILYTYAISADDRLARKAIDDYHRSLRYDGTINCCYPSYEPNIIPGFSLFYVLMIYDHMMYFGDKELVKRYMPTVESIFAFFTRAIGEDGLVGKIGDPLFAGKYWSFIDWTAQWDNTLGVPSATMHGAITMESFLFATVLTYAQQLAEFIGKTELANEYKLLSESIKHAIKTHCRGKNGLFQDGPGIDEYSQHCQVWAVLSETVVGEEAQDLMERVLSDESLAKCSVAMAYYMFRALEKAKLYEKTKNQWQPWREMIQMNLTTCVEDPVTARSDCHAWGSLILYELPATILGVRPAKPGFEEIIINPIPGYLDWAKGEVITPKGTVKVSWEKVNGELVIDYVLPEGMILAKEVDDVIAK